MNIENFVRDPESLLALLMLHYRAKENLRKDPRVRYPVQGTVFLDYVFHRWLGNQEVDLSEIDLDLGMETVKSIFHVMLEENRELPAEEKEKAEVLLCAECETRKAELKKELQEKGKPVRMKYHRKEEQER